MKGKQMVETKRIAKWIHQQTGEIRYQDQGEPQEWGWIGINGNGIVAGEWRYIFGSLNSWRIDGSDTVVTLSRDLKTMEVSTSSVRS